MKKKGMCLLGRRAKLWEESKKSVVDMSCLVRFVMKSYVESSPLIRVVKSSPLLLQRGRYFYKRKFSLQYEILCPVFRAFPVSLGYQMVFTSK